MAIPHHDDTITELPMKSLVVELLEDLFKVSREIHDPVGGKKELRLRS